jgi:hypothetical protein
LLLLLLLLLFPPSTSFFHSVFLGLCCRLTQHAATNAKSLHISALPSLLLLLLLPLPPPTWYSLASAVSSISF